MRRLVSETQAKEGAGIGKRRCTLPQPTCLPSPGFPPHLLVQVLASTHLHREGMEGEC